jgi:two-component system sensor histidine kinase QseC
LSSIRRRLLLALLPAVALIWLLVSAMEIYEVRHELEETHDAQLVRVAEVLATLVEANIGAAGETSLGRWETLLRRLLVERGWVIDMSPHSRRSLDEVENLAVFQVWSAGGDLVARSATAPQRRLGDGRSGFADVVVDGHRWRTFTLHNERHEVTVIAADADRVRDEAVMSVLGALSLPFVVGLPLVAGLVWIAVGQGLKPLTALSGQIARRSEDNLEAIDGASVPVELRTVVESLNRLLSRLLHALERERRFTADASHELRTPLAAIRTQAQVALRSRRDGERRHALEQVVAGVDRTSHLVDQLLALARCDSDDAGADEVGTDLGDVAARVVADYAARHGPVTLRVDGTGPAVVCAGAGTLELLVRNLVDNAVRYSPPASPVEVTVNGGARETVLSVSDHGPGIGSDECERVFERFYRGRDVEATGSGLGLSIVRRVADAHHASVELVNRPSGGLDVRVRFPTAAAASPATG